MSERSGTIPTMVEGAGQARVRRYGLAFKLDATNVQAGWFARSAGSRRWCFNQAVALVKANHEQWASQRDAGLEPRLCVKALSAMDLRNALKKDRPEWLTEVSVWVLEFAAVDAAAAGRGFLAGRTRFPKFAKKGKGRERWTEWGRQCRLEAGVLRLPKIGNVRIASPDPDQGKLRRLLRRGRARITSVTVARHADGTWWASCKVDQQLRAPAVLAAPTTPMVGLDRGIKTAAVAATADGRLVLELEAGRICVKGLASLPAPSARLPGEPFAERRL